MTTVRFSIDPNLRRRMVREMIRYQKGVTQEEFIITAIQRYLRQMLLLRKSRRKFRSRILRYQKQYGPKLEKLDKLMKKHGIRRNAET